jgi:CRP/FNR family transcriptional regulator, anaerobic regulatory protein
MGNWLDRAAFLSGVEPKYRERLDTLVPQTIAANSVLFRAGDPATGFIIVLSGVVHVYLTGRGGREMLLYSVVPGQTCLQTTLGVLGGQRYAGEAVAVSDLTAVLVPMRLFDELMAQSPAFRTYVFQAFGERMGDMVFLLEQVAFVKVEQRLAGLLLSRADAAGNVAITHHDLAVAIGSVREVISRRLEALSSRGIVSMDRGHIHIVDERALARLAQER